MKEKDVENLMRAPGSETNVGYIDSGKQPKKGKRTVTEKRAKTNKNGPVTVTTLPPRPRPAHEVYEKWVELRLKQVQEFDSGQLLDDATEHLMKLYGASAELLREHLPALVRSYASRVLYQYVSGTRPGDDWLALPDTTRRAAWFENADGTFCLTSSMTDEQLGKAIEQREAFIRGNREALDRLYELRDAGGPRGTGEPSAGKVDLPIKSVAELMADLPPGFDGASDEYTGMCWYCGLRLPGPEEEAPSGWGPHQGPRCANCNVIWARAYATDCPKGCKGFNHLQAPSNWRVEDGSVNYASGSCWCDSCGHTYAYEWKSRPDACGAEIHICIAGLHGSAMHGMPARDIIASDS